MKKRTYFRRTGWKIVLTLVLLMSVSLSAYAAEPVLPNESGRGEKKAIVVDAKTGAVIFSQGGYDEDYPASMTKILTSIVVDEHMKDGETLTVSAHAAGQECSCLGVSAGEQLNKEQVLHALMIKSANDVAVAVAEHIGGSVAGFAKLMNEKAKELGATKAHFVTPNGLHDPEHHVSPYEMTLFMREALKHPAIVKALEARSYDVKTNRKIIHLSRTDKIFSMPYAIAGKTGFTSQAGNTLVSVHQNGEKEVITVVMQTRNPTEYKESAELADYAFSQMEEVSVVKKGQVAGSRKLFDQDVSLLATDAYSLEKIKGKGPKYTRSVKSVSEKALATKLQVHKNKGDTTKTLPKGTEVATLQIYEGDTVIKEIPLVTQKEVRVVEHTVIWNNTQRNVIWMGLPLTVLGVLILVRRRKKRPASQTSPGVNQEPHVPAGKVVYRQVQNHNRPYQH